MERKVRLIIEGQDRASNVINGVASNTTKSLGAIDGATKRSSSGATKFLKAFLAWQVIGGVVHGVQSVISGAINGIGAAIMSTVNSGMEFEQTMSAIKAVTRPTAQELDQLRSTALRLGKDTVFTSTESARAIEELAKAGVSTQDIINGTADAAVALASAGSLTLEEAALVMSKATNSFGFVGEQASFVADVLTGAANASATSVHNIGEAVKYAGGPMQALTSDAYSSEAAFVDLATAVAITSQAGIDASMSGAGLQRVLEGLTPNSEKAEGVMKNLGLITEETGNRFFDAKGDFIGLKGALDVLHGSLQGLTQEETMSAIEAMFGQRAGRVVLTLMNQVYDGAASWDDYRGRITEAGVASDTARVKLDNLAGAWEFLKGSVEFVQLSAWTKDIETALAPAVVRISEMLNNLGVALQAPEVQESLKTLATNIANVVTHGIDILEPRLTGLIQSFGKQETRDAINELGKAFEYLMNTVFGAPEEKPDTNSGLMQIRGYTDYMATDAPVTASEHTYDLASGIRSMAGAVRWLADTWKDVQTELKDFKAWWSEPPKDKPWLLEAPKDEGIKFTWLKDMEKTFNEAGEPLMRAMTNFGQRVDGKRLELSGKLTLFVKHGIIQPLKDVFKTESAELQTAWENDWQSLKSNIGKFMTETWEWASEASTVFKNLWDNLKWAFDQYVSQPIEGVIQSFSDTVGRLLEGFDWSSSAATAAGTIISGIVSGLLSPGALGKVIGAAASVGASVVGAIKKAWNSHSPSKVAIEEAHNFMEGLLIGFGDMSDELREKTTDIAQMVRDIFGTMISGIDAMDALAVFRPGRLDHDTVAGFANDLFGVVETIQAVVLKFSKDGVKLAAEWATSANTVVSLIGGGIDALEKLKTYRAGLMRDTVLQFAGDVVGVVQTIEVFTRGFAGEGIKAAAEWATAAGSILGIISGGIDSIVKLQDYKSGIMRETVEAFGRDVAMVVEALRIISERWTDEAIARAATIADGIGRILAPITGAVDAFESLRDYKGIMPWMIDMLGADIRLVVDKMVDLSTKFDAEGVEAAAKFADAANRIIAPVKTAVDTFTSVNEYKGLSVDAFKTLANDFTGVIGHLTAMWKTADQEGVTAAADFADAAGRIFGSLKTGLDSISAINEGKPLDVEKAKAFFNDVQGLLTQAKNIAQVNGTEIGFSFVDTWQSKMIEVQPQFIGFLGSWVTSSLAPAHQTAHDLSYLAGEDMAQATADGLYANIETIRQAGVAAGQAYSDGFNSALSLNTNSNGGGGGNDDRSFWTQSNGGTPSSPTVNINVNGLTLPEATERIRQVSTSRNAFNTNVQKTYGTK